MQEQGGYIIENQPVHPNEIYATQIQEERVRNVISQLDPDNQLKEIEMRIRGYKKNIFSNEWEKIDPSIPEPPRLLVSRLISYLSSVMNQSTTFGNLSDRQINAIMRQSIRYIVDEIDSNSEIYNLKDNYTERTRVGHIILNSMFIVLNRSLNGQEAKRLLKTLSLNENMNANPSNGSKFMEALKFWK